MKKTSPARHFCTERLTWFAGHGVRTRRLLTDNTLAYRRGTTLGLGVLNVAAQTPLDQTRLSVDKGQSRTLLTEWTANSQRAQALHGFLDHYNTERGQPALGGKPPISRLAA